MSFTKKSWLGLKTKTIDPNIDKVCGSDYSRGQGYSQEVNKGHVLRNEGLGESEVRDIITPQRN